MIDTQIIDTQVYKIIRDKNNAALTAIQNLPNIIIPANQPDCIPTNFTFNNPIHFARIVFLNYHLENENEKYHIPDLYDRDSVKKLTEITAICYCAIENHKMIVDSNNIIEEKGIKHYLKYIAMKPTSNPDIAISKVFEYGQMTLIEADRIYEYEILKTFNTKK